MPHEPAPVVVTFVGAAIDHEAPRSMTIFLEIPLNVVGVVVMRGILGRPSRHCELLRHCVLSCSVMVELRRWRNSLIVTCGLVLEEEERYDRRSTSDIIEANI